MANSKNDVKKTIRLTDDLINKVENIANELNISNNDVYKMLLLVGLQVIK